MSDVFYTNRAPQVGDKVETPDGRVITVRAVLKGGSAYRGSQVTVVHPNTLTTADANNKQASFSPQVQTAQAPADGDTVIWGSLTDGDTVIWGS